MPSQPAARNTDVDELRRPVANAFGGRYVVLSLLGEGGMGAVYRVRDVELEEEIALKVLHPSTAALEGAVERFRREVKLARKVTHPNVARVFDVGHSDGRRFLTMELVEGESLMMRARRGKLPMPEVLRIVGDVARGLAAAHAAGVVHRDLKPDNVLLEARTAERGTERVVVTDFGIAVLAQGVKSPANPTRSIVGTPEYMAPEQLEAEDLDGRADVYALGIMFFELLTRRLPFEGRSPYLIAAARLMCDAPSARSIDPGVPEPISNLIEQMLQRARDARPDMLRVVDSVDVIRGGAQASLAYAVALPPAIVTAAPAEVTVLVAPFLAPDATPNEVPSGVADSIGDTLSSLRGVRVVPAATVRRTHPAQSEEPDAIALAGEHGADLVIQGSVRTAHGRLRLRARIVSAKTGVQIWGEKFEADVAEFLTLEDGVAWAVKHAVRGFVADEARAVKPDHPGPSDPEARALYEQGAVDVASYGDALDLAIRRLRQANEAAPNDPLVMSALGAALVRSWSFSGSEALLSEGEDWSLRALATGARIGQTFNTIGVLRLHQGDLRAAVDAFREATARAPMLAQPHSYLGRLLSEAGFVDEARRRLRRAVDLDPSDHHAVSELARIAAMAGEWDESDALLEGAAVGRNEAIVRADKARFAVWRNDPKKLAEAVAEVERRSADPSLRVVVRLVLPVWKAMTEGNKLPPDDERIAAIAEAARGSSRRLTMFWYQLLAEVSATFGHDDAALEAVEDASMRTLIDVAWLDRCPALAHLRPSARLSRARAVVAARAAALWR